MNIPFKQTANYQTGTQSKRGYVLHQTLGNFTGACEWLLNANRPNRSSAHYIIGRNEGEVLQIVKVTDDSWHAGYIVNPAPYAKKYLLKNLDGTYVNPNRYTIGIEFASRYDINGNGHIEPEEIDITDWQYRCAMAILDANKDLIPVTPDMMLMSHQEVADYKSDDTVFIRQGLLNRLFPDQMISIMVPISKRDKVLAFLKTI